MTTDETRPRAPVPSQEAVSVEERLGRLAARVEELEKRVFELEGNVTPPTVE